MGHQRPADAFVDDTALCFTSSSDETSFNQLVEKLQHIAQTWEYLLFLSGGIESSKVFLVHPPLGMRERTSKAQTNLPG